MSRELDLGPAGSEGMVFLAAGAGGRGSVALTAARACDDGAAINNSMEAPTPELPTRSLLFSTPHPLPISPPLALLSLLILCPQPFILSPTVGVAFQPLSVLASFSPAPLLVLSFCTALRSCFLFLAQSVLSSTSDLHSAPVCSQVSLTSYALPSFFLLVLLQLTLLPFSFIQSLNHKMSFRC